MGDRGAKQYVVEMLTTQRLSTHKREVMMIRMWLYGMVAIALICLITISAAEPQSAPALPTLIASVDTSTLARAFHVDLKNTSVRIDDNTVIYRIIKKELGTISEFAIGVFPNINEARQAFIKSTYGLPLAPIITKPPSTGEEFVYWKGREGNNGWPSRCLFRRVNCILSFSFAGKVSEMIELAKEVDMLLINSNELAPKGVTVVVPPITISSPATAPIGSTVEIEFQSTDGIPIRISRSRKSDLVKSGNVLFAQTDIEGKQTISITMATAGNVVFTRDITVEVVSKERYAIGRPTDWNLPEDALYFLTDQNRKWETIPSDEREWILLARGTFQYIGSADEKRRLRQLTLADFRKTMKSEWLPEPELITVALDHSLGIPTGVAYCSYTLKEKGCNIAYMGSINKGYLLYLEQQYPLPQEAKPISVDDILLPSIFPQKSGQNDQFDALPEIGVVYQSYIRYRSLRPTGDFQKVQVLLTRVKFSESLSLRLPNF